MHPKTKQTQKITWNPKLMHPKTQKDYICIYIYICVSFSFPFLCIYVFHVVLFYRLFVNIRLYFILFDTVFAEASVCHESLAEYCGTRTKDKLPYVHFGHKSA